MPEPDELLAAQRKAARYLAKRQQPDGSFLSYSSASLRPFRRTRSWHTTFVPALMLGALSASDISEILAIRRRLARFLLGQKRPGGAFNYWADTAVEHREMAYPDDLDDTFCALAALKLHDPALVDEGVLAQSLRLLLATETAVGGPYRTWLVAPDSDNIWRDVDLAVNSNVAFFLSMAGSRLPNLDRLMADAIREGRFSSPYYPTQYPFLYYLARAYRGPEEARLLDTVRREQRNARTDLDLALCILARLRLDDTDVSEEISRLLAAQRRDGSWAAAVFYADPDKAGRPYYDGGPELTTAFVVEALATYQAQLQAAKRPDGAVRQPLTTGRILAAARGQVQDLDPAFRRSISQSLKRLAGSEEGAEITGLASVYQDSLKKPAALPQHFLDSLGAANLYGWLAYTIFDDLIDEEGRTKLLPVATLSLRRSLQGFLEAARGDPAFQVTVHETFDMIDGANRWELASCRYGHHGSRLQVGTPPDYGDLSKLAERSFGHALGPLAVILRSEVDEQALMHCRAALKQHLIVRQLHDDLHDWQEDLAHGHASYVVARLLADNDVRPDRYDTAKLTARLREAFWNRLLPDICDEMKRRVSAAQTGLKASGLFKPRSPVYALLDDLERTIEATHDQQRQATIFLEQYKKPS